MRLIQFTNATSTKETERIVWVNPEHVSAVHDKGGVDGSVRLVLGDRLVDVSGLDAATVVGKLLEGRA